MNEPETFGLLTAVFHGDIVTAEGLITNGVDINQFCKQVHFDGNRFPVALNTACLRPREYMVRLLVEHGADVEITNRDGSTCLIQSINHMTPDVLKYLLNVGARVNRHRAFGNTALHLCDTVEYVKLLLEKCAAIKKNENGDSPIISAAFYERTELVQFLHEYTVDSATLKFIRHSNKISDECSSVFDLTEIEDAYKLLGACRSDIGSVHTIENWSTAVRIRERRDVQPKEGVNITTQCACCMHISSKKADNGEKIPKPNSTCSEVDRTLRGMVSGIELLQHTINRSIPTRMSNILPCLHCPTSTHWDYIPSLMHQSINKSKRCRVHGRVYLEKWQHLKSNLQSLYANRLLIQRYQRNKCVASLKQQFSNGNFAQNNYLASNTNGQAIMIIERGNTFRNTRIDCVSINPTAIADAILGIEPACFTPLQYQQNKTDPISYYLQRQWLVSHCQSPPRTAYRSSYSVCAVCGYMVIRFGEGYRPQSPGSTLLMSNDITNVACRGCSLTFHGIANEKRDTKGDYSYRNTAFLTNTAVADKLNETANKQNATMKVCSQCGLVSEHHPLLQRLRKSRDVSIGDIREFTRSDELAVFMDDSSAVRLQKSLINLRFLGRNDPYDIKLWSNEPYRETGTLSRYVCQLFLIYSPFYGEISKSNLPHFERFILPQLEQRNVISIDPNLIVDYIELAVNHIERKVVKSFYRLDEQLNGLESEYTMEYLSKFALKLMSLILSDFLPEVKLRKSYLQGQRLIESLTEEYIKQRDLEDSASPSTQLVDVQRKPINGGNSDGHISQKHKSLSQALTYRFITQIYRLVCLNSRSDEGLSLINFICLLKRQRFRIDLVEVSRKITTVRFLLRLGAHLDCVYNDGQTVVGYLLEQSNGENLLTYCLLKALLEGGAHMDAYKRKDGGINLAERLVNFYEQYKICPVRNGRLACLAATAMRCNGLTSRHAEVNFSLPRHMLAVIHLH